MVVVRGNVIARRLEAAETCDEKVDKRGKKGNKKDNSSAKVRDHKAEHTPTCPEKIS